MTEGWGNRDVALVDGIGEATAARLREHGIATIGDLARAEPGALVLAAERRFSLPRAEKAVLHARALAEGRAFVLPGASLPPPGLVLLDLESSCDRHDDPWLLALIVPGASEVVQVEALDPRDQGRVVAFVGEALRAGPGRRPASWGTYDRDVLRKCCRRLDIPPPSWLSGWFDAHAWMRRTLVPPCPSYGLKPLAGSLGFAWDDDGVDGYAVGRAYAAWRDRGRPMPIERFRAYNQDDVRAMARVVRRAAELVVRR